MAHHAYYLTGDREAGVERALQYAAESLGIEGPGNPDIAIYQYEQFPVEDARRIVLAAAQSAVGGSGKLIIIAAGRIYHEAQNALLKVFEEPPEGTTLVLVIPAVGDLLPTMRSRLLPLPIEQDTKSELHPFLAASTTEREKMVTKLIARSKSEKDEEKQAARLEALRIVEDLTRAAYPHRGDAEFDALLIELDTFTPILHERSAPLKLIFEHLLIVLPKNLLQ